ncbi:MAG: hypothetical protein ACW987_18215, partial [Candidatus Thorarchaeota archaeon]
TSINDKVAALGEEAPSFRPPFLEVDTNYIYRVAAMQTGNFISNFSRAISVNTFLPVTQPIRFSARTCDTNCEPFFVTLNWDTRKDSGTVDKWIIERAVVNNFAAANLNTTNISDIEDLDFEVVEEVHKESSRSRSRTQDSIEEIEKKRPGRKGSNSNRGDRFRRGASKNKNKATTKRNSILKSQHHFIDSDVAFGNTYFYRITAIGINLGNRSRPLIKGVKISTPSFERKLNSIITQSERNKLSRRRSAPLRVRTAVLRGYRLNKRIVSAKKSAFRLSFKRINRK